ncbi:Scr1 family TA system antitoxin-like transcriptional regulator [Embleya hyalina]|uniref:Scr1 family TA system antitoxin-like transcriptional regulator n=1 Tax=Embleya hyalina TaxID=516124 RepID=UPI0035305E66
MSASRRERCVVPAGLSSGPAHVRLPLRALRGGRGGGDGRTDGFLLEAIERRWVQVRIVRFAGATDLTPPSSMTLLRFPHGGPQEMVYLEHVEAATYISRARDVERYRAPGTALPRRGIAQPQQGNDHRRSPSLSCPNGLTFPGRRRCAWRRGDPGRARSHVDGPAGEVCRPVVDHRRWVGTVLRLSGGVRRWSKFAATGLSGPSGRGRTEACSR